MGMNIGRRRGGFAADINVTPLIDVLLVLLIIFLVVMPLVMKMETAQIPPKIDQPNVVTDTPVIVTVHADMQMTMNDGNRDESIVDMADLRGKLAPKLDAMHLGGDKVVFVDFDGGVPWGTVLSVMDEIRFLASDNAPPDDNHNEIKVALKVKTVDDPNAPK